MFHFSLNSKKNLETCHKDLQQIFNEVIKTYNCTILCGYRNEEKQEEFFELGATKVHFPFSKHNQSPSMAIDVAPYPINWKNTQSFHELSKVVFKIAKNMDIKIRWGGDWDSNGDYKDQNFIDLPHYELI